MDKQNEQMVIYELLGKWGVPNEKIAKLIQGDKEYGPQQAHEEMKEHVSKLFENDPEFISRFKNVGKAELGEELKKSIVTTFGLTVPDGELNTKGVHDVLGLVKRKTQEDLDNVAKLGGDNDKIIRELNDIKTRNVELQAQITNYREQVLPEYDKRIERERENLRMDNLLMKEMSKYDVITPRTTMENIICPMIISQLRDSYDIIQDNNGNIEFLIKGQKTRPTNKTNDRFLQTSEIIKTRLEEAGVLKQSNAKENGLPERNVGDIKNPAYTQGIKYEKKSNPSYAPHINRAQERLLQLQKKI